MSTRLERRTVAKIADYTIRPANDRCGTTFTNRGATGAVIFTLPTPGQAMNGQFYDFRGVADFAITVKPPTVDTALTKNDAAADSVAASTSGEIIGAWIHAYCDGTAWILTGLSVGHTFTVAT